jgi:hypothetical protein
MHAPLHAMRGDSQLAAQLPFVQTVPEPHEVPLVPADALHTPEAPQLVALVFGSMHTPWQSISVPGHVTWQLVPEHTAPDEHAMPALPASCGALASTRTPQLAVAPQLVRLVVGSTHVPLQSICDPGHETWQLPPAHTVPLAHDAPTPPSPPTPHALLEPQLLRLVFGSTHTPPQLTCVPGHETAHDPFAHTLPFEQVAPLTPPSAPHPARSFRIHPTRRNR